MTIWIFNQERDAFQFGYGVNHGFNSDQFDSYQYSENDGFGLIYVGF